MENSYLDNKIILNYCKDYYRIINEEFSEHDFMTGKLIQIYQSYIFSINVKSKIERKKITILNDAVVRYFEDREFKKILINFLIALKVSKKETNILEYIANSIIKEYEKYMEGLTRNLYIPRWI
ncbi:MAG: hypothetical protein PUA90_02130 [bacterium]|nr:hypothetical protein [bacterium]